MVHTKALPLQSHLITVSLQLFEKIELTITSDRSLKFSIEGKTVKFEFPSEIKDIPDSVYGFVALDDRITDVRLRMDVRICTVYVHACRQ